jgi:hypothetical protein
MKTAQQLFERLGVASLADLERALDEGALSTIPRLGPKSIENIRRGVLSYKGRTRRTPLGTALPLARESSRTCAMTDADDLCPGRQRAAPGTDRRRHRHRVHVGERRAVVTAFTAWERAKPCSPRARRRRASGWRAGCRSICACCRRTSTATCCSTSPARANTTSSFASSPYARTCA